MKRYFKGIMMFVLSFLIIITASSCNRSKIDKQMKNEYLSSICEVEEDIIALHLFNHTNLISSFSVSSVDSNIEATKKIQICGKEFNLSYYETLYYPISEKKVHKYMVEGNNMGSVLLNEDGSVSALLFNFVTLDIDKTASPESVRALVEPIISTWTDVSKYKNIDMPKYDENNKKEFGMYSFLYFNTTDGYMTDYMKVSVSDNGDVSGFSINDLNIANIDLNIDDDLAEELLVLKLEDIYTTSESKYLSHDKRFSQIVLYKNELHIQYTVSVTYRHSSNGEASTPLQRILIPVRFIDSNAPVSTE